MSEKQTDITTCTLESTKTANMYETMSLIFDTINKNVPFDDIQFYERQNYYIQMELVLGYGVVSTNISNKYLIYLCIKEFLGNYKMLLYVFIFK